MEMEVNPESLSQFPKRRGLREALVRPVPLFSLREVDSALEGRTAKHQSSQSSSSLGRKAAARPAWPSRSSASFGVGHRAGCTPPRIGTLSAAAPPGHLGDVDQEQGEPRAPLLLEKGARARQSWDRRLRGLPPPFRLPPNTNETPASTYKRRCSPFLALHLAQLLSVTIAPGGGGGPGARTRFFFAGGWPAESVSGEELESDGECGGGGMAEVLATGAGVIAAGGREKKEDGAGGGGGGTSGSRLRLISSIVSSVGRGASQPAEPPRRLSVRAA